MISTPTVALVDDHALIVHALATALGQSGITCVAVAPRPAPELMARLGELEPTVVLLDMDLGGFGDSTMLIGPLTDADIRVVILTGVDDPVRLGRAVHHGAVKIVQKGAAFPDLVQAIAAASRAVGVPADRATREFLTAYRDHDLQTSALRAPFELLTEREQQTLAALARGLTVHQISQEWVVAETTVRSHVRAILQKLGARSQLQAVVRAVHAGWIDPESD